MKVLFDYQTFEQQNHGGISRYFVELILQLKKDRSMEFSLPIEYSSNVYLEELPEIAHQIKGPSDYYKQFITKKEFPGKFRLFQLHQKLVKKKRLKNQRLSIQALREGNFDVFHPSYYDPYFLTELKKKPFVITVHDMIHELFPGYFPANDDSSLNKKKICEQATKIIAISENTKTDLVRLFSIDPTKIEVVHLSTSLSANMAEENPMHSNKYLLYIGNRTAYKNFQFLVNAVSDELKNNSVHLVCCGGGEFSSAERSRFKQLGIEQFVYHYPANDHILSTMYKHALAFIFPSLYEGFGIPTLEAFACRCPCLLSNGGSLKEIGASAAAFFDPTNQSELKKLVQKCIHDEDFRQDLIQKGIERNRDFSWELSYKKTKAVYAAASRSTQ